MVSRIIRFALIAFLFASAAAAQSPSKVLKQAEKALGGQKAMRSGASLQRTGTITRLRDGSTGSYRFQTSRPNLFHESYDLAGLEFERGYNGRSGWVRDSRSGLRTLTGEASVGMQAEAVFRNTLWLEAKRQKAKIAAAGTSTIEGRPHQVLSIGTSKGVNIKLHIDASTGLISREEIPAGGMTRVFDYADYRKTGASLQPYRITITEGEEKFAIAIDDVKTDQLLPRSRFDFPAISGEPLPDMRALLAQLQENEDKVEKILETYSFVQKSSRRELGKDGVLRETSSETLQLSFYKGYRISRLIEKNGQPLNAKDQLDADKDAEKRVEEIERIIAKKEKNAAGGPPDGSGPRVSIAEVLRASNLINPRRERFRGRDVIVFDFEPNPAFDLKNARSMLKFFGKTAGVMWIDEKDKQVARLEAYLFDSYNVGGGVLAKLRKGASFVLEQERVNDEIWLPSAADINLSVRVLLVKGIDVNQMIRSYDYRKFATEVRDATVTSPTP